MQSPTLIFNYMTEVEIYKGFISRSYYILLHIFLKDFPLRGKACWEQDVEPFEDEQWEVALQAVQMRSLNAAQTITIVHHTWGPSHTSEALQHGNERGPYMF